MHFCFAFYAEKTSVMVALLVQPNITVVAHEVSDEFLK
jgi:hypothetical protein